MGFATSASRLPKVFVGLACIREMISTIVLPQPCRQLGMCYLSATSCDAFGSCWDKTGWTRCDGRPVTGPANWREACVVDWTPDLDWHPRKWDSTEQEWKRASCCCRVSIPLSTKCRQSEYICRSSSWPFVLQRSTGSVSRIALRRWNYSECCLRDVLVKLEMHLPNSKQNNFISRVPG